MTSRRPSPPGHRRGARDGALAEGRADAPGGREVPAARFAHGAAAPPDELARAANASLITAKYGQAIDPQSAHEIITARLASAHAAAAGSGVPGATQGPVVGAPASMTAVQQQREIDRQVRAQAREIEAERRAAAKAATEAERQRRAQARAAAAAERERQRTMQTAMRTAGRVVSSREGQNLLRGLFGILGGGKGR